MLNDTKESTTYSAPLVYKVFSILREIAETDDEMGISDLSRRLGISKSTIYGVTQALLDLGVITQDGSNKKFRLGPTLIQLGSRALARVDIRALAKPVIENLSNRFRETTFLGTFDEKGITIIERADSPAELKISAPVGTRIPIYAGAAGKVFLAGLKDAEIINHLSQKPIPRFTEKTITNPEEYLEAIRAARQDGYATDFEEYIRGVNAICVPVPDPTGSPSHAIWMVGFSHSFTAERMEQAVKATRLGTEKIGQMLG